jgi:signal transduction histidine kinase
MSAMALALRRSEHDRVVAGVCAGIAEAMGVDPTLVRLVFTLLALAGGAGIALYAALWFYMRGQHWIALLPLLFAGSLVLHALGLSATTTLAVVLIAVGLALIWRRGASLRPDEPLSIAGIALTSIGAVILLTRGGTSFGVLAPGAVVGALLLIIGPWLWQLARERDAERTARIRSEERADVAARVHDSVLQTLTLIQKDPNDARRLARRQERELRSWLYPSAAEGTLVDAVDRAAAEIEEVHGVRVEVVHTGDAPLDEQTNALVLAAREAMANAARHAGVEEISVFVEPTAVYVRDRGRGFDPDAVAADRRGLSESIRGRMERVGGTAKITTSPGEGTEVELML